MTTKEKIKNTILEILDKYNADDVTVKMFCLESGLSKQTLYNHYYNLMDAIDDSYKTDIEEGLKDCNTYLNWVEGFRRILMLLHDKKNAYLHIYNSSRKRELIGIIGFSGRDLVEKGIEDCAADMGITISEKDKKFMTRFYMNVFMGIIKDYLDGRMSEDPEYIAGMCDAMLGHHIRNTLDKIGQK
jgi:hypothetical protein